MIVKCGESIQLFAIAYLQYLIGFRGRSMRWTGHTRMTAQEPALASGAPYHTLSWQLRQLRTPALHEPGNGPSSLSMRRPLVRLPLGIKCSISTRLPLRTMRCVAAYRIPTQPPQWQEVCSQSTSGSPASSGGRTATGCYPGAITAIAGGCASRWFKASSEWSNGWCLWRRRGMLQLSARRGDVIPVAV